MVDNKHVHVVIFHRCFDAFSIQREMFGYIPRCQDKRPADTEASDTR